MTEDILETFIQDYLALGFGHNSFAWQGGEPTLMGLGFFRRAVELQSRHSHKGQIVANAIQTNGLLLDRNWCEFLAQYKFLVGISLDGPPQHHDYYRRDHAGNGTFDRVMAGIEACRGAGVEFNLLVLVNDRNVEAPDELFDFLVTCPTKYLQFIPCVEHAPSRGMIEPYSVTPAQYGSFLCRVFDRWLEYGPTKVSIRLFDSVLAYYVEGQHTTCTFGRRCNDYVVIEHNGDVFCCDFFVTGEWKLGNVTEAPVGTLYQSKTKRRFAGTKRQVNAQCLVCRHFDICRGGCLKDRMVTAGVSDDISYFCRAYQQFFDHAGAHFMRLSSELRATAPTGNGNRGQF